MNKPDQTRLKFFKVILLLTSCLLGFLLWASLNNPVALPDSVNVENKSIVASAAPPEEIQYVAPDISEFDEVINRPLFFADRKPYVYVAPEKPIKPSRQKKKTIPKKTEQYSLNAVIITPERQLAIIQSGRGKTLQRLSLGEEIEGWTLETIEPRSVLLKKGNETKSLELEIKISKPQKQTATKTNKTTPKEAISQQTKKTPPIPIKKSTSPDA